MTDPDLRVLSLGAGVQSTVLALMAADGTLPGLDGAIFADTGWEPRKVYDQVDRLDAVLTAAGIPLYRVSAGNLRDDSLNPAHRYASLPVFVLGPPRDVPVPASTGPCACRIRPDGWAPAAGDDIPLPMFDSTPGDPDSGCELCKGTGSVVTTWSSRAATRAEREGLGRRQCTSEYKLAPINRKVRELLGAAAPDFRRVPRGRVAEQWIGFSTDEIGRVSDKDGLLYSRKRYPLLDLGMNRVDCQRWLAERGWGDTVKSACLGCPFHGNSGWRTRRDTCVCGHHRDDHRRGIPGLTVTDEQRLRCAHVVATEPNPDDPAEPVAVTCGCDGFDNAEWRDAVAFDAAIRKGGARGLPLIGEAYLHRSRVPLDQAPIDKRTRRERAGEPLTIDSLAEDGDPDGCSPYGCRSGASA